ncbi:hypothetical protein PK69_07975 [Xanthomonas phaseoli pv. phaseoli]|nr:hypothetical protein AC609_04190 [Xanthomonas phaseoli pv. phaseoli]AZU32506.1 hypothetical protein AC801_22970 [Xanthomonas sp. ISO98C4]KUF20714.1 hypothetical protein AO826_17425 [Xanthomonas phaseoli pv. manihotis]AZU24701.1 hypothetical protein AC611_04195 [Xanthomonas phaseoli pv. phaseoli]AZU33468.1 hypothetical protein AC610_04190 [Xanthomonas phaseoli pv. phaseoli]
MQRAAENRHLGVAGQGSVACKGDVHDANGKQCKQLFYVTSDGLARCAGHVARAAC